jgi:carbon-monoxide dehydrogenase large subunit
MPGLLYANAMHILIPGAYRLRGVRFEAVGVGTNKASYIAFRGPWAVETWVREVLIDAVSRELGLDPVDVRRANTIRLDEQPTQMVTGPTHDGMAAELSFERAVDRIGYVEFRAEQERARAQGRYLGVGFSTFVEASPGPPDFRTYVGFGWAPERMEARIEPDGHVTVVTAQSPHGQGHETTVAQVIADTLGVPFEHVRVVTGDTRVTPFSVVGTGGSRAATLASGAALTVARKVRQQALELAAHLLEANPADLDLVDGVISVHGSPDVTMPLAQVARTAYFAPGLLPRGTPLGLQAVGDFVPVVSGWALATHACVVEVDVEVGTVKVLRYVVVEDCGDLINPAIVEGQIRGGTVQGISAALFEHAIYDDEGNLVTDNLLWDYTLPTVMDLPRIEIEHLELPPIGEVNFRGVGEGGAVGAPAAVTNAVADAIGVDVTELPITPNRVLELVTRERNQ